MVDAKGSTQVTRREFDRLCLPPVEPLSPSKIKKIREQSRVSQSVFAALLNTSVSTVQKWEISQKRSTGTALKLLHLVQSVVSKSSSEFSVTGSTLPIVFDRY